MQPSEFDELLIRTFSDIEAVLSSKAKEYARSDRLHNFKQAAQLTPGQTNAQALAGMMKKHTISIYDMINSGDEYSEDLWSEKILDHINYLILLRAVVSEDGTSDGNSPEINFFPPAA